MLQTDNTIETVEKAEFDTPRYRDFNGSDRCDRCGAQAWIAAHSDTMSELLFCGHHGRKFTPGLIAAGFSIEDQTHRLVEDRATGSEN